MKRLYQAGDLSEAYLIADLLRQDAVEVRIMNEHARGGMGDLPFAETYPELWLVRERDWTHAQQILEAFHNARHAVPVKCPTCREENPGNFETCWQCNATLVMS